MDFRHYGRGNALILTSNKEHAGIDRMMLQQLQVRRSSVLASGAAAIEYIRANEICFVLIDSLLEDMKGLDFMTRLDEENIQPRVPALMVCDDNSKESVIAAIQAGCNGYVVRPYNLQTFDTHLQNVLKSLRMEDAKAATISQAKKLTTIGKTQDAINELEGIVDGRNEAQEHFERGLKLLSGNMLTKAIYAFNEAIKFNSTFAEAYKGIAAAYRVQGDKAEFQKFMQRAMASYAAQDKLRETRILYTEVLKVNPKAMNPFNVIGMQRRKKGDFKGALEAYFQARKLSPKDENLLYNISNAYLFLKDMTHAKLYLAEALLINPQFENARILYRKLTGKEWTPPRQGSEAPEPPPQDPVG